MRAEFRDRAIAIADTWIEIRDDVLGWLSVANEEGYCNPAGDYGKENDLCMPVVRRMDEAVRLFLYGDERSSEG